MKLPNNFGSVYKLAGKRRRPFVARKTIGWTNEGKQIKKIIGYSETKQGALQLLAEFNTNPYDTDLANITFETLYEKWLPWKIKSAELSKKSIDRYKNVKKYYEQYFNTKFIDISFLALQTIIDNCPYGYATKSDIKTLYSQLYNYANQIGIPIKKNISEGIFIGKKEKSELHIPFTESEIALLWNNTNISFVKLILINIYTGFRPTELLYPTEINIKEHYIKSGIKTEAGIDRIIPINDKIYNFVIEELINLKMSYNSYNRKFNETMAELNLNHTPYDCRHTFATLLDNANANKLCIKLLMGHSVQDITDGTYTHKTFEQLKNEINKI